MPNQPALDLNQLKAQLLTPDELKLAASLLYQSYHDDPVFMEIFQSEKTDYEQRLRAAIREELNVFWQEEQPIIGIFIEQQLLGVACVTEPGSKLSGDRFWHWRLKMLLTAGFVSTKQLLEKEQRIHAAMPVQHYHMLAFIAISPKYQHLGLGHYLMHAVDSVVEKNPASLGIGVFVTLDKNKAFFNSDHYQQVTELNFSKVKGTLMFRARQSSPLTLVE
ncbi:GNAT family N-acetyltransferase [Rheinheimera sediminis]|uniref:GNAT family N-acetyltransferase n=1 Tax=Rheinheimera sp. YQF-1 TaxID=2499626 RepID=UPI0021BCFDB1|nr:GNAT family N-acetyltransferase [Rheinheimera sp. YQF-1]